MTEIKCRYIDYWCPIKHIKCSEPCWRNDGYGRDFCEFYMESTRKEIILGTKVTIFDNTCLSCEPVKKEFARNVKRYSFAIDKYDEGHLEISGRIIYTEQIEYLEIDGRVLIGGTDGRSDKQKEAH